MPASAQRAFPPERPLDDLDFTFQRSVKKQVIQHSRTARLPACREKMILLGPPDTSKTRLAVALAIPACLGGRRFIFRTATEWVALLPYAQRQGRLDEDLKRLERIPMLVRDEVGYIPFDPHAADLVFMLVSRRYELATLLVTSNKPFFRPGAGSSATAPRPRR